MLRDRSHSSSVSRSHRSPCRSAALRSKWPSTGIVLGTNGFFFFFFIFFPATSYRKFVSADDIYCCSQAKSFEELEKTLTEDMDAIASVLHWNGACNPVVAKTVSCVFHLHNANANAEEKRQAKWSISENLSQSHCTLGVTLDRSLTYHDHLMKTSAKVRTSNKIIQQAGWLDVGCTDFDTPDGCPGTVFLSGRVLWTGLVP